MGLTQKLGTIPLAILTDSSNNVGIGAAANASFKLQVTGATNLTGALSGTSATFSSSVTATAATFSDIITNTTGGYRTSASQGYILRNDANSASLGGFTRRSFWAGSAALDTQIFAETGYGIFLNVNGSVTTGINILSSGNVGIGTSSPTHNLEIKNASGSVYQKMNADFGIGYFGMETADDSMRFVTAQATPIQFYTDNTERMRITSGGLVLVGTTSHTDGSMFQTTSSFTSLNAYRQASGGSGVMGFYSNNFETKGVVAYIKCDGGLANYSANNLNLSDERTKNSIIPIESYWDKFKAIEIVKFKYNGQIHDDYNIGVIAQQVELVAPEFVSNEGWGVNENNKQDLKSIYESDLHHATIKVLQECMAKIEEQQAQIEELRQIVATK